MKGILFTGVLASIAANCAQAEPTAPLLAHDPSVPIKEICSVPIINIEAVVGLDGRFVEGPTVVGGGGPDSPARREAVKMALNGLRATQPFKVPATMKAPFRMKMRFDPGKFC